MKCACFRVVVVFWKGIIQTYRQIWVSEGALYEFRKFGDSGERFGHCMWAKSGRLYPRTITTEPMKRTRTKKKKCPSSLQMINGLKWIALVSTAIEEERSISDCMDQVRGISLPVGRATSWLSTTRMDQKLVPKGTSAILYFVARRDYRLRRINLSSLSWRKMKPMQPTK